MYVTAAQYVASKAKPFGRVVITAYYKHSGIAFGNAGQKVVKNTHRLGERHRFVIYITGRPLPDPQRYEESPFQ